MIAKKEATIELLENAMRNVEYAAFSNKKRAIWRHRLLLARYAVKSAIFHIKEDFK